MSNKKPKYLTLIEKAKILDDLKLGKSVTFISKEYGIAKSTVCSIKKKESCIISRVSKTLTPGNKRTLRKAEYSNMEDALYKWFLRQRERNFPIDGKLLKTKAKQLHNTLESEESKFFASEGWLQKFKKRYGIRFLSVTGEKLSSQPELVNPFKRKLAHKIAELQLTEQQIYNADESALYWQLLPRKTYAAITEKTAPGIKLLQQRLTFLACANATGEHKLKPLVIGKSKNPRTFRNFKCPVEYKSSKSAWMTTEIFKEWFFKCFIPQVKTFLQSKNLQQKALLLLDNAPCHATEEILRSDDGQIFVMFMPPNVTPLIQPMDQNAIRLTKLYYRSNLLTNVITKDTEDIVKSLKSVNLKDAVLNLSTAWDKLESSVISKCWRPILAESNSQEFDEAEEDNIPLAELQRMWSDNAIESSLSEAAELLQALQPTNEPLTARDIEEWNRDLIQENEDTEESDIESVHEACSSISANDAVRIFTQGIDWAAENGAEYTDIRSLQKLRQMAILKTIERRKVQSKVTSFFPRTD